MSFYFQIVGAPELQDLLNEAGVIMLRLPYTSPDDSFELQDEPRQPGASSGVI